MDTKLIQEIEEKIHDMECFQDWECMPDKNSHVAMLKKIVIALKK